MIENPHIFSSDEMELVDYTNIFLSLIGFNNLKISKTNFMPTSIRFETNNTENKFVLEFYFESETNDCEAQIRIFSLVIPENKRGKGLSKIIINKFLNFCKQHGDMSLQIIGIVSKRWYNGLMKNGACLIQDKFNEWDVYINPNTWKQNL